LPDLDEFKSIGLHSFTATSTMSSTFMIENAFHVFKIQSHLGVRVCVAGGASSNTFTLVSFQLHTKRLGERICRPPWWRNKPVRWQWNKCHPDETFMIAAFDFVFNRQEFVFNHSNRRSD